VCSSDLGGTVIVLLTVRPAKGCEGDYLYYPQ
jgi:hypothetical protein